MIGILGGGLAGLSAGYHIEKAGRKVLSDQQFDDEGHLRSVLDKMLALAGRRLSRQSR